MIEVTLYEYLKASLQKPVYMEMPSPIPSEFYLLEKTGGNIEDHIGHATFALQSYGKTLAMSVSMSMDGVKAMLNAISLDTVSSCTLNSEYNFPDLTRKKHRYQAVFNLTHYETE